MTMEHIDNGTGLSCIHRTGSPSISTALCGRSSAVTTQCLKLRKGNSYLDSPNSLTHCVMTNTLSIYTQLRQLEWKGMQPAKPGPACYCALTLHHMRSPELEERSACDGGRAGTAAGLGASSAAGVHTVLHSFTSTSPCGSLPPGALTTCERPCATPTSPHGARACLKALAVCAP